MSRFTKPPDGRPIFSNNKMSAGDFFKKMSDSFCMFKGSDKNAFLFVFRPCIGDSKLNDTWIVHKISHAIPDHPDS